jgi:hypothetical protein
MEVLCYSVVFDPDQGEVVSFERLDQLEEKVQLMEDRVRGSWWEEMACVKGSMSLFGTYANHAVTGRTPTFWRMIQALERQNGTRLLGQPTSVSLPALQHSRIVASTESLKLQITTDNVEAVKKEIESPDFKIFAAVVCQMLEQQRQDCELRFPNQRVSFLSLATESLVESITWSASTARVCSWNVGTGVSDNKVKKAAKSLQRMLRFVQKQAWGVKSGLLVHSAVFL